MVDVTNNTTQQLKLGGFEPHVITPTKSKLRSRIKSLYKVYQRLQAPLSPLKNWLDQLEVKDAEFAHMLCQLIPSQCPFERDVAWFGTVLFHIPPLCKLNPCYEQLVFLRFRALCYLADECHEDISRYC